MKKIYFSLIFILPFVILSCGTTSVETTPVSVEEESVEEPVAVEEEPVAEIVIEKDEYERSTAEVSVTKEVFNEDKAKILHMVKNLDIYMKNLDYKGWLTCLDEDSKIYWSRPQNLKKAANRLPKKGLRLNTLEDYFRFVFIPARVGHNVDEIRYETEILVKAVQVEDDVDVVYYNFHKIDDQWKLVLPKNHE